MNTSNPTILEHTNDPFVGKADLITKIALFITLLFIFLVPFGDGIWDGLPRISATLAIGFSLILFLIHGTHRNYNFFHFFSVLYIAWQLISLMWTPDFVLGKKIAITSVQLLLLAFLLTLVIDNKKKIIWAYQAYVFGNIVGASIIISNYLQGIQSPYYNRYGIKNIETDTLSIFLAISIPMAAYLATKHHKKFLKLINIIAIPLVFYAIFLTGTRTGSIVGLIGIAYWIYTHRKASIAIKASITVVMIVSVIAIFSFAPKASVDRIFSSGKSITTGTLNYRSVIWRGSLNQWKKTPIIGTGLGGLGFVLNKEHINFDSAHNTYIHNLTENGIIGLLLYLAIVLSLLYYILQTPSDERAFMISLLMVVLVSQLTTHTHTEKVIWIVFSLLAIHTSKSNSHSKLAQQII